MLHKVNIKGVIVPIHAKNEAQLKYAIRVMEGAFDNKPELMEEYRHESKPDEEQDGTINSAAVGRPYPF